MRFDPSSKTRALHILVAVLFFVALLLFWQIGETVMSARAILQNRTTLEAFIPTPLTILQTFVRDGNMILREALITFQRAFSGFIIGTVLACLSAVVLLYIPIARRILSPLAVAMNSFPIIGFAPAIILIFGQGSWSSIVVISALLCYFPTLVHLHAGFDATDQQLLDLVYVLNATRLQELVKIRIPLALPFLFTSMRLSIPASVIGATMGEWLGTRQGIGQLITIALYQLKPGLLYASFLTLSFMTIASLFILSLIEHRILFWHQKQKTHLRQ